MSHVSSKAKKEALEAFRSITSTTVSVAERYLKGENWKLEQAIDRYFAQTGGSLAVSSSSSKVNEDLFTKYKNEGIKEGDDEDTDAIQGNGLMKFVQDLGYDPTQIEVLVLCWKLRAKTPFQISRDEFLTNMIDLNVEGLNQIKKKLPSWKSELNTPHKFKDFYYWVFEYNKASKEARSLTNEVAVELWKTVMSGRYKHLGMWLEFVEKQFGKAVTRDVWQQFYDYSQVIKQDFSNYDEDSAWPVLLDDFTDYAKKTLKASK